MESPIQAMALLLAKASFVTHLQCGNDNENDNDNDDDNEDVDENEATESRC